MTPFPPTPLSPATQAAMMPPSQADETRLFEDKFGQMAHQVFGSQFPDLTESVITFKILDSDIENNSAVGAFILERNGQFLYVPVILSDNQLKPFDLVYVKDKDIFLPLTDEWVDELSKGLLDSLGEGTKLPPTVPTDVDIRNIVVPPTTGRYSYAHYVTPTNRLAAEASEPLGRRLHKFAGSVGESTSEEFNPEVWATFNEQFQRVQGQTPGQAIDNNVMDVTTLAKMYKQHARTWDLANQSAYAQGMDPAQMKQQQEAAAQGGQMGAPAPGGQMGAAPPANIPPLTAAPSQLGAMPQGMERTAAATPQVEQALSQVAERAPSAGDKLDNLLALIRGGAAGGAAIGGVRAGLDTDDLSEVPGGMIRGAVGGAIGAPLGRSIGGSLGHTLQEKRVLPMTEARQLGALVGAAGGGYIASGARHTNYEHLKHPFSYGQATTMDPYGNMVVTAADHSANLISMLKHAQNKSHEHSLALPDFLKQASNVIKQGFCKVLTSNPRLMKIAAEIYGEETLIDAVTPKQEKVAAITHSGGELLIADKNTPPNDYFKSFGEAAPAAFNGVLLKGFYYKDTRPSLNMAVQTQTYHDFHDTQESGVYLVYPINKPPEAALVVTDPIDLFNEDRPTFPKDSSRVKHVKVNIPNTLNRYEVDDISISQDGDGPSPHDIDPDVERSHVTKKLFILGNGEYGLTNRLIGEQIAEIALKDSKVANIAFTDKDAPLKAGKGIFIYKRGVHYFSTLPVEISDITTGTDKTITAKIKSANGFHQKSLVIDPRSPLGRISRPRNTDIVIIPSRYKWLPLGDQVEERSFLSSSSDVIKILINALGSMGVSEIVARKAGESMYSVNGEKSTNKVAALRELATRYCIHATAADAMLKLADANNISRAYLVSPQQYFYLRNKIAQQMPPAPPGLAAAPPAPVDPNVAMGQMGAPPVMGGAPEAPPSPIDQAFQQTTDELQEQINQLQAQLSVLVTVQERANQISAGGSDPNAMPPEQLPQDPNMAGAPQMPPEGMPPAPPAPPSADMGADPYGAMAQDPSMQGPPPGPVMRTEEPSASEIAAQVNPAFLEQAGQFQDMGAFDAGAIGSLAQTPSLKDISSQYAANLEDSVDDLGRTLLTLYMQEPELKEQLGEDAFVELEDQLRNTFKNLGKLTLNLSHNTAQLNNRAPA